jgi:TetR/AcrR family transcriptional regulator, cholesterol catabolism regulator
VVKDQQPAPPPRPRRGRPRLTEPSAEHIRRREEIIETAARVFHARGYETGSLDDVAEELGLRKASLYYYVDSKAQLLYWIFDRAISLALERLDELSEIADPGERLAAFVAHQVSVVAEERSLFTVFFESRPRLNADYEDAIRQKERRYIKRYVDAVANAVDAGVIPEINPRHGAQAILGMASWVYKWFDPVGDNWADVAGDFIQLILRARVPVDALSSADIVRPVRPR